MTTSRRTVLILTLITSMQVLLLQAKSLRRVEQSAVARVGNVDGSDQISGVRIEEAVGGANPLCSPGLNQMEYYSELYKDRVTKSHVKGIRGNTMYYSFRANNSRAESENVDDLAVIASIIDHSRFAPAGMETANKAICAQILHELDAEASVISNTAVCPWDYICDYKEDRFPHYLFKARCKTSVCSGNCSPGDKIHNMCQSHGIHVTVLQMRGNCGEWVWGQELPIACTCTNDVLLKA